ncbi:epidermal retinol dehydrogenase 2 isoform X1 [Neodiprion pinetum]|uniref:Epidermal retinol dehydrogenase 2 isoform X1 n=2 Tax=Neodiprion lecontei TaxID=441921 RepID=A0A6J0BWM1_NEOLC|nr:epidermal retinol dehydrogenase 2 isoform X1 [Neodiprion lecontei]XP_046417148.1 epidermal retinol dehydrogenase 2-like isoform X1 [Neodiprion fabricii]XP_046471161.1 epidermal retinol dehydrogenase 2-like isoform X1 [Neodiprion pinetum]
MLASTLDTTVTCAIMVTAYAGIAIFADIFLFLVKVTYFIVEGTFRIFFPVEEKSVAGEIVLITGAGHGIGRELALQYASLGAKIVCWDLNEKSNNETAEEIKRANVASAVYTYKCDVTNREEVFRVSENVRKEVGDVTILVNNAGIMPCRTLLDHTPEEIRKIFDVNVIAHFWTLQAFLPSMIEKNHGHVVALSSMAGISGLPNLVPYCGSKFAVRGLMEATALELRDLMATKEMNIKFTCVFPYMVDTGLCKKPKVRFPSIMSLLPPKVAATEIVRAQRRNIPEASIPGIFFHVNNVARNFPTKVGLLLRDFLDSGVEAD